MRRISLWMCVAAVCVASPLWAGEPKSADDVIAKHLEAIGGLDKIKAIKSIRMSGKISQGGGMEFPATMEFKRPHKMRMEFTVQGMTGVQAYNGSYGWMIMPFMGKPDAEKMPPEMADQVKDEADMDGPLVDYKDKGHKVELLGDDEIEGTPTYKLKVTKKDGNVEYHHIDKDHFLGIAIEAKRKMMGTELDLTTVMSDFKDVDGRILPHSIMSKGSMGAQGIIIDKIEINVPIEDSHFEMPEADSKDS